MDTFSETTEAIVLYFLIISTVAEPKIDLETGIKCYNCVKNVLDVICLRSIVFFPIFYLAKQSIYNLDTVESIKKILK